MGAERRRGGSVLSYLFAVGATVFVVRALVRSRGRGSGAGRRVPQQDPQASKQDRLDTQVEGTDLDASSGRGPVAQSILDEVKDLRLEFTAFNRRFLEEQRTIVERLETLVKLETSPMKSPTVGFLLGVLASLVAAAIIGYQTVVSLVRDAATSLKDLVARMSPKASVVVLPNAVPIPATVASVHQAVATEASAQISDVVTRSVGHAVLMGDASLAGLVGDPSLQGLVWDPPLEMEDPSLEMEDPSLEMEDLSPQIEDSPRVRRHL
jgi:hypothetical protein